MALNVICFATLLYFLIYAVNIQGSSYNEVECRLLPTQNDISSEFRLKASEKGVRMVYLNLKMGNDSYQPLELQDEFLADRWVWADNISEPMLTLPEDYDILSLGLLNYQVRSMDVQLEDQPSGCLANLNSTRQNVAVGRMLLENVTIQSSGDQLSRNMEVVCVAVIDGYDGYRMIVYRCCGIKTLRPNQRNGPLAIQCDLTVEKSSDWMDLFNDILFVIFLFMSFYLPALPLALPDCIFSLQNECDKEDRTEAEQINSGQAESAISMRNSYEQILNISREEEGVASKISRGKEEETGPSEIPLDDSGPVTCSALLLAYIQKLPDLRLSFNIKLAVMLYCILPCVIYVQTGLWLKLKKKYIHESFKKQVQLPGQSTLFLNISPVNFLVLFGLPSLVGFALVLFLRPKDLLFRHEMCPLCKSGGFLANALPTVDIRPRKNPNSIGNEIRCHLKRLQQLPAFVWTLTQLHTRLLEKLLSFSTCSSLSMVNHHVSRMKRTLCVLWVLFSTLLTIPVGLFGAICFSLLLFILVFVLLFLLSPYFTLLLLLGSTSSRIWGAIRLSSGRRLVFKTTIFVIFFVLMLCLTIPFNIILVNSSRFIIYMLGFIMIGLYFNVDIVTPYVAFFLVVTTNIYLCYANLQNRYKEFKGLILKYTQKKLNISNGDQDTIPTNLFWFVSDRVLPIATETCRLFCNMALIIIFLSLFLSAVLFFRNTYSISVLMSTISVFVSGMIPGLFFKGITNGKVFIGWEKIKMKREIEIAVEEFYHERNGVNSTSGGMESSETSYNDQV